MVAKTRMLPILSHPYNLKLSPDCGGLTLSLPKGAKKSEPILYYECLLLVFRMKKDRLPGPMKTSWELQSAQRKYQMLIYRLPKESQSTCREDLS
jgi:hypothetical protein